MTGTEAFSAATRAAPSLGWRMAMMSAYRETVFTVSATLSPFAAELASAPATVITFPPSSYIAASKLSRVRVLGSKNSVASFFRWQASA